VPADKKTPIRAADRKSNLRAHKRVAAEAVKKNILLEEAIAQMNAGKYSQASAALKQLLATNPDNLEARRLFATLHLKLGSRLTAKTAFESLAQEAVQRQDYWLAESLLKEYLAAGPRYVPFLELLGHVYEEKGDPMSAVVEYGKAIEILVEDPDSDQPNRAADLFAKVKELAPTSPVASRFAPVFGGGTTTAFVTPDTMAEVAAPPAPAGVTEPAVEPTESVSTEAEQISEPTEQELSVERDPLLPSLHMAPEVEPPSPEPQPAELHAEPATPAVQDTVESLPPLPLELLTELGLQESPFTSESEADQPAEQAVAETREVDLVLPSVELAPAVEAPPPEPVRVSEPTPAAASGLPPEEETPEPTATVASVQADPLLPSVGEAPAVEVEEPLPKPLSAMEPEPEPEAPPAPPPEPIHAMDRLAESAGPAPPAAGYRFIEEDEASVEAPPASPSLELAPTVDVEAPLSEPVSVIEPEPEPPEPSAPAWQPVWEEETPFRQATPTEPAKAVRPEPAVASTYRAVGEIFAPGQQSARVGRSKTRTAPSLASRLARQAAHVRLRVSLFVRGCISTARFLTLSAVASVTISLVLIVLCIGVVSILWFSLEEKPSSAFYSLTKPPSRSLQDPKGNGYLLLLGFGASPSRDPVQAGYETTVTRAEKDRVNLCLNNGAESSSPLRFEATTSALPKWFRSPDPPAYFQNQGSQVRNWMGRHDVLMSRYRQWLRMPFDDWGFGEIGTLDCTQILVAHRLYVAEGFTYDMEKGVERLGGDLAAWRTVLAQGKTLSIKMMAAEAVYDDVAVVSGLLTRPDLPVKLLPNLIALGRPLDEVELSLRWPMQNQLVLEAKTMEAGLKTDAGGERPFYQRVLMRMPLPKQRTLNRYASYYEAMIKAAETSRNKLPKRYDFARTPPQAFSDYLMNPIDNGLAVGSKPEWEEYSGRIMETDAFLRLLGLQARIRKPPQETNVLARVARAGQGFYDPFTGFPMLFNVNRRKLYSVGKNGKDDDGDPKLDVTVSIVHQSP
jgi:hypothetical protein